MFERPQCQSFVLKPISQPWLHGSVYKLRVLQTKKYIFKRFSRAKTNFQNMMFYSGLEKFMNFSKNSKNSELIGIFRILWIIQIFRFLNIHQHDNIMWHWFQVTKSNYFSIFQRKKHEGVYWTLSNCNAVYHVHKGI